VIGVVNTGILKVSEQVKVRARDNAAYISLMEVLLTIEGNWIAGIPIPDQTLETRETCLEGKDKELLLGLARKILRWLLEDRPSAQDLFGDEILIQWAFEENADAG
jgi:hypothetical protein